jgi:hypothetical protein
VTETHGELAYYLSSAYSSHLKSLPETSSSSSSLFSWIGLGGSANGKDTGPKASGVYDASESNKLTVLNGSSISPDEGQQSILVFPDYKVDLAFRSSRRSLAGPD